MSRRKPPGDYEVGYGKPPVGSQFRKGQCGNPGGRPRGITAGKARMLLQKEAYRLLRVKEGDRVYKLSAFEALLRRLITSGKPAAQLAMVKAIMENDLALVAQGMSDKSVQAHENMSQLDLAWRIAFLLTPPVDEQK